MQELISNQDNLTKRQKTTGAFLLPADWRYCFLIRCFSRILKKKTDVTNVMCQDVQRTGRRFGLLCTIFILENKTKTLATIWLLAIISFN